MPIQASCEARIDTIVSSLKDLVTNLSDDKSFAVDFDVRNNAQMHDSKVEMIKAAADLVGSRWKVNLKSPEQSVLISVCKHAALLASVNNYSELSRYNIQRALGALA
jgi:tRNA(Ser,Leu) C12 N-acetylase TAN1